MPSQADEEYQRRKEGRHIKRVQAQKAQRQRRTLYMLFVLIAVALVIGATMVAPRFMAKGGSSNRGTGSAGSGASTPTLTPAEQRIEAVRARCSQNCTRDQPQSLTDPNEYAKLGREQMERIAQSCGSWEGFQNADSFSYEARQGYDGSVVPYLLAVNRASNTVTAYALDAEGRYTVPYMAMTCSTGTYTPIGYYATVEKYDWLPLFEDVYGQYATRIVEAILFHSVPYYNPNKDDLEYEEYDKLGTSASLGCVRMQVCDVKWIYDNCPVGTPVVIYDDAANPGPMGRPGTIRTNEADTNPASATYRGFDPTDPDPANPWNDAFVSGTAIRSDAAQKEWEEAQRDGRWTETITPANLRGSSTDAESRG